MRWFFLLLLFGCASESEDLKLDYDILERDAILMERELELLKSRIDVKDARILFSVQRSEESKYMNIIAKTKLDSLQSTIARIRINAAQVKNTLENEVKTEQNNTRRAIDLAKMYRDSLHVVKKAIETAKEHNLFLSGLSDLITKEHLQILAPDIKCLKMAKKLQETDKASEVMKISASLELHESNLIRKGPYVLKMVVGSVLSDPLTSSKAFEYNGKRKRLYIDIETKDVKMEKGSRTVSLYIVGQDSSTHLIYLR